MGGIYSKPKFHSLKPEMMLELDPSPGCRPTTTSSIQTVCLSKCCCSHLVKVAKFPGNREHERQVRNEWRQFCSRKLSGQLPVPPDPLQVAELDVVLKNMKSGTAAGYDNTWISETHGSWTGSRLSSIELFRRRRYLFVHGVRQRS